MTTLINTNSWRDAVCKVIDQKLKDEKCFSSGEITKEIREQCPDLRFSHWDVGEYIRDLYFNGSFVFNGFPDRSDYDYVQVVRYTSGKTRTPYGMKVFVYAPTLESGLEHEFEVEIPRAKVNLGVPYDEYGTMENEGPRRGEENEKQLQATVQKDKRIHIPRSAFDALGEKTGKPLSFGDKVHISLDEAVKKIKVKLQSEENSKEYGLTMDRGRVKYLPNHVEDWVCPWGAGDAFDIQVTEEGLEIDVSEPSMA